MRVFLFLNIRWQHCTVRAEYQCHELMNVQFTHKWICAWEHTCSHLNGHQVHWSSHLYLSFWSLTIRKVCLRKKKTRKLEWWGWVQSKAVRASLDIFQSFIVYHTLLWRNSALVHGYEYAVLLILESDSVWEEAIMVFFKVLFRFWHGDTEETDGRLVPWLIFKYVVLSTGQKHRRYSKSVRRARGRHVDRWELWVLLPATECRAIRGPFIKHAQWEHLARSLRNPRHYLLLETGNYVPRRHSGHNSNQIQWSD